MIFDSAFKCEKQIRSVVKAIFFQLRLLAKVKPYLPFLRHLYSLAFILS